MILSTEFMGAFQEKSLNGIQLFAPSTIEWMWQGTHGSRRRSSPLEASQAQAMPRVPLARPVS
jgi:hypothetical protein